MNYSRKALNSYTLSELKSQLSVKLRFPIIGKPDCFKLSQNLLKEGYGSVSVTTLYRLFINYNGIIPYQNTLDILVNYIGYSSWSDFVGKIEVLNYNYSINQQKNVTNTLIYHCIESSAIKPLNAFFESIEKMEYQFKTKVALDVYDSLLQVKKPELFFSKFHANTFVKQFVLEDAFDPYFRIKNYDYAYKLYSDETKKENSIEYLQDYVFSRALLFRHYFLTSNFDEALLIGNKIFKKYPVNSSELNSIHIFPNVRYRAYKLWYLFIKKKSNFLIDNYIEELLDFCRVFHLILDDVSKRIIFQTIAEVFCSLPINKKYHLELKTIFIKEFEQIPAAIFEKSLEISLPYFEANGLLHYRPLK